MPTAYCHNTKCSHFRAAPVRIIGGRSFPGHCNVWDHEMDENGMCLDKIIPDKKSKRVVKPDQDGLCETSGIPGTPCDKDNCNSGCVYL